MRKTLLSLLALAGLATSGAATGASAMPVSAGRPVALPASALLQHAYYDDDWRAREWRRHRREEEWRRHEAWERWHHEREGERYGRW